MNRAGPFEPQLGAATGVMAARTSRERHRTRASRERDAARQSGRVAKRRSSDRASPWPPPIWTGATPGFSTLRRAFPIEVIGKLDSEAARAGSSGSARRRQAGSAGERRAAAARARARRRARPALVRCDAFAPHVERGRVIGTVASFIDVTDRKVQEEHLRIVLRELAHRSKNLLAVIQGIARQTAESASSTPAIPQPLQRPHLLAVARPRRADRRRLARRPHLRSRALADRALRGGPARFGHRWKARTDSCARTRRNISAWRCTS